MINDLINYFKDKKILILGFGKEGQSTYKFIRKYLKEQVLYIAEIDENFNNKYPFFKQDKNVKFISGENYLDNLEKYDIIMKTPGISFKGKDISKLKNKIKSEMELLLEFFHNKIIGITGTKGKSTTSSLIYKILKEQNVNALLLGNIGIPVFDYLEQIKMDTVLVLEMSSHQLEFMQKSPNISIITNLFPEHLDHYNSYENYAEAKGNIYKFQTEKDFFIYNSDNKDLSRFIKNPSARVYKVSYEGDKNAEIVLKNDCIYMKKIQKINTIVKSELNSKKDDEKNNDEKQLYCRDEPRKLCGDYNLNNIMLALGVSEILGLDINITKKTISEFEPLPHRLEFVGEYDDIKYYDNSIATIPKATIEAIKALNCVDTLIIGGMDRGIDYTDFAKYLDECNIRNIICMPKTGHDIANIMKTKKCHIVNTMEDAVKFAKKITAKGKICLLSPAAASYGFFKNFEERGDLFKKILSS